MFNKNDYAIIAHVYVNEYNSPMNSITLIDLISRCEMSASKVRLTISAFLKAGYLSEGLKEGNNKTIYLTEQGINHCKQIIGEIDDNKEEETLC